MSAWLCGKGTLSLVVDVIKSEVFKKEYDVGNEYSSKSEMELIEELSNLNTKSLDCRYGKSMYHILSDKEYLSLDVEEGQKHKSVCCYLYQTCECEENYENPLFKSLEQWSDDLRETYEDVWDKYQWDIDMCIP